jgi:uncharacterized protein YggE
MLMKSLQRSALLLAASLSAYLCTAQSYPSLVKVQGEAKASQVPELMHINIPLSVIHKEYEACSSQLVSTFNELQKALVKAGIAQDQIKSDRLSIQEQYNYYDRERKLEGYAGSMNVFIKMPHDDAKLSAIMRTLRSERFKFGYHVGFSLSEKQKEALQAEALGAAIADAKLKAETMATALGLKLISVQEINYGYVEPVRDILMKHMEMAADMRSDDTGDLKMNPDLIEVYRNVGVVWTLAK